MEYVRFDAVVEPLEWGDATYTVVRLPADVVTALGSARRVEGEFNEHPINLAITRAPVIDDPFLWSGKSLLARTGLKPGERFEARLRPANADEVDVPDDLQNALRSAGKSDAWEALSPGKRRGLIYQIDSAKRSETRLKRIQKLLTGLP